MLGSALFVFLLLWGQDSVWSVQLVEMRVPDHVREGGRALLGCQYDMEGEVLYSVKWYKDELEFFRYVPKNYPQMKYFKRPGVHVDMTRSSSTVVALDHLTHESEGIYSCEVSGESPSFNTSKSHKKISVHLLPSSGPYVTGAQESYFLDQIATMNCTSLASRPHAQLRWTINDQPVPQSYLQNPWTRESKEKYNAAETILQLRFMVMPQHFVDGAMHLKCLATIVPLYQREVKSTHYVRLRGLMPEKHDHLIEEPFSHATDTSKHSSMILCICFAFMLHLIFRI